MNTKIKDINDILTKAQHGDLELIVTKPEFIKDGVNRGNYICGPDLVDKLKTVKVKDLRDFIKKYDKILIINGDGKFPSSKYHTYLSKADVKTTGLHSGYYFHQRMFILLVQWLDQTKFDQYSDLLNIVLQKHTLKAQIKNKPVVIQKVIKEEKSEIKQLITKMDKFEEKLEKLAPYIPTEKQHKSWVSNLFRSSISTQVGNARELIPKPSKCPFCAQKNTIYHLDHDDFTVNHLQKEFMKQENINENDISNETWKKYHPKWLLFHNKYASYQYLCEDCNHKKGKMSMMEFITQTLKGKKPTIKEYLEFAKANQIVVPNEYRQHTQKLEDYLINYEFPESIYGKFDQMTKKELCQFAKDNDINLHGPQLKEDIQKLLFNIATYKQKSYKEIIEIIRENKDYLPLHYSERDIEFLIYQLSYPKEQYGLFSHMQEKDLKEYGMYYKIQMSDEIRRSKEKLQEYLYNYKGYGKFTNMSRNEVRLYAKENKIVIPTKYQTPLEVLKQFILDNEEKQKAQRVDTGKFDDMNRVEVNDYIRNNELKVPQKHRTNLQSIKLYLYQNDL